MNTVQPYAPMLAPVYVMMRQNQKLVAIKGPLDFFTPDELERLKVLKSFYFPEFIDSVLPFRNAAQSIHALLNWKPDAFQTKVLAPSPYEVSDSALRLLAPLWGRDMAIEPFFITIFATELCDKLSPESLVEARDKSIELYEKALFSSSWAVFLALHLGYLDLAFLNRVHQAMFDEVGRGKAAESAYDEAYGPVDELLELARGLGEAQWSRSITANIWTSKGGRAAKKITARVKRIQTEMASERGRAEAPTIFGERGFVDG